MHSLHFTVAMAMISAVRCATIAQRDDPNEIVYLCNCDDGSAITSEMDYYSDFQNSKAGQQPDSIAVVSTQGNVQWEAGPVTGTFAGSGVKFTSQGLTLNTPIGSATGSGSNGYADFTCFREQNVIQYTSGSKSCGKLYSCAHSDHIVSTQTTVTVSSNTIDVQNGQSGNDAMNHVFEAYQSASSTCDDSPHDIGGGCNIVFTCTVENPQIFNALAQLLVQGVGAQVPAKTLDIPASCPNSRACTVAPGTLQCCDPTTAPAVTFPATGSIDAANIFQDDPMHPSQQASVGFTVSCPVPSSCNNGICTAITGAIGAVTLNPIFALLGAVGTAACLACQ